MVIFFYLILLEGRYIWKKSYIIGIVVAIIVVIGISLGSGYNKMVKENENVESAAAQIDVQLKRRTDLIPNLVNTVKGYMTHEQKLLIVLQLLVKI